MSFSFIGNAPRIQHPPTAYRLMQKKDGQLVLQGAFRWEQGVNGGFDWQDIPTVDEPK
jgi:hypothetical protein